jgi:3-phenylpropionate/cinnamic acid dioxygenase small subunit
MGSSERQIENLIYNYAERLDDGNIEGMAELLKDAEIAGDDGQAQLLGAKALSELYRSMVILHVNGTPMTHHVTSNVIIDVDEEADFAKSRAYFTVFQATEQLALQAIVVGRYHDEFARVGDKWHFTKRRMLMQSVGNTQHHLRSNDAS